MGLRLMVPVWVVLQLAGLLCPAFAQADQPSQQLVHFHPDGRWQLAGMISTPVYETIQYQYTVMVNYQEERAVEVDGQSKTVTVTVCKPETRVATKTVCKFVKAQFIREVDPADVKAFEIDGRPIAVADLPRRIAERPLVVIPDSGQKLPAHYAAVFKPGTVVLVLPPPPTPMMAPPAPAPGPISVPVRPVSFERSAPGPSAEGAHSPLPASPPPQIVFASRSGADGLKVRQYVESTSDVEVTTFKTDAANSNPITLKIPHTTRHSETAELPLKALRISNGKGEELATERIKERLGAGETSVLLSFDGRPVDEFWLQNIQPQVLVLRGVELPPVNAAGGFAPAMPAYPALEPVEAPAPPAPQ
jgi:hypothetical protein